MGRRGATPRPRTVDETNDVGGQVSPAGPTLAPSSRSLASSPAATLEGRGQSRAGGKAPIRVYMRDADSPDGHSIWMAIRTKLMNLVGSHFQF